MPRSLVFLIALLLTAPPSGVASADDGWRAPVVGALIRGFSLSADHFAAGQHRGIDLGAPVGTSVRAACPGRVTFSGTLPGGGRTVSVRCGGLIATYQQLGSGRVRRGAVVGPGASIGTVGASIDRRTRRPHVHLSARSAATGRYLDPMTLIRQRHGPAPLVPPGRVPSGRRVPLGPAPAAPEPLARPAPVRAPTPAPAPRPAPARTAATPLTVWLGLGAVGLGLPLGGLVSRHRRRRKPHSGLTGSLGIDVLLRHDADLLRQ